jgi:hypothetical protein
VDTVDVSGVFPRPRDIVRVRASPQYGELFARVWRQLRSSAVAAARGALS